VVFPGRVFVRRETYTQCVHHEEQDQQAEPGARLSAFNAGENTTMEPRDGRPCG